MKPKVIATVGLCVKNAEATIQEAIDSILDQDFPHELMELIVVDGYSKDKTLLIVKENLAQTDIRNGIFRENDGLGFARQIVVDNATGDYIVWVDGDMILSKDFLRRQVEFMERNSAVGIGKGKYEMRCGANLVATLEDIEFVLNSKSSGKTTSKALGTSGCIYRIDAIREVGGFDEKIKGVGEDMDAEYRVRMVGWLLHRTHALFCESRRKTWKALWKEYFWNGYGAHYLVHKNSSHALNGLYKMLPPVAILVEFSRSLDAYRLTGRKAVFLLPLHYTFKRIAWSLGFVKGHLDGYGHAQ